MKKRFLLSILTAFLASCGDKEHDAIRLDTCGEYPNCDTTNDSSSGKISCSPQVFDFATPCFNNNIRDTIQFRFSLPQRQSVELHLLNEDGTILQTLFTHESLQPGFHTIGYPNPKDGGVIGCRLTAGTYSRTFWFYQE